MGRADHLSVSGRKGFTLIEVMVALIIGTVIVGGVMGLISVSLQYTQRVKEKSQIQPVLEAAAEDILANPEKALNGSLSMGGAKDSPTVDVQLMKVESPDGRPLGGTGQQLFRVMLNFRGHLLEFSLLIPQSALK